MTNEVQSLSHVVLMGIRPEQDITGYIAQESKDLVSGANVINRRGNSELALEQSWFQPTGLAKVVKRFPKTLRNAEWVILKHTCFLLHRLFLNDEDAQELYRYHLGTESAGPKKRNRHRRSKAVRAKLALCPDCYAEDMDQFGYATRRRLHLVGGIFACHQHRRVLLTMCKACQGEPHISRDHWDVEMKCGCGEELVEVNDLTPLELEAAISVARMAQQILDRRHENLITAKGISQAIRLKAFETTSPMASPFDFLHSSLERRIGTCGIRNLGFTPFTIKCLSGYGSRLTTNPVQNLTAIYAVFGSLEKLEKYLQIIDEENPPLRPKRWRNGDRKQELSHTELESQTEKYRIWLKSELQRNPQISRKELSQRPNGTAATKHLRDYDTDYFDKQLPRKSPRAASAITKSERNIIKNLPLVKAMVQHIRMRRQHLVSKFPTKWIHTHSLIGGAKNRSRPAVRFSDKVMRALARCSDTEEKWRKRSTKSICFRIRSVCKDSPYGNPSSYKHLTKSACANRINKAEKWLKQKIAKLSAPL